MALVKEIQSEGPLTGKFLVLEVQQKTAKNGSTFLAVRIGDSSGEIPLKVWDIQPGNLPDMSAGRILSLQGAPVKSFNGNLQVEVDGKNPRSLQVLQDDEVVLDEFLPATPNDAQRLWNIVDQGITQVKSRPLASLLRSFFNDPVFRQAFGRMPAALRRHQVYLGGLLEHTAGVLSLCLSAAAYYPNVDRELLIVGALLHDIGKVRTYRVTNGFEGTDEGRLIGHLILGTHMVGEAIRRLRETGEEFPSDLEGMLQHLLISHHGIMEWGSPVEPLTLEACILHHADNFDAQVSKFQDVLRQHAGEEGGWSPYDANLGRSVYIPKTTRED